MSTLKKQAIGPLSEQDWRGSTGDSEHGDLQDSSAENRLGAQKPVRLLLVDSMPVVLKGLEAMVAKDPKIAVVGRTGDHDRVVTLVKQVQPGLLLIDILGKTHGSRSMRVQVDVLRKVKRISPKTRCIVFTNFHPKHMVETALDHGAVGVWSKFDNIDDLVRQLFKMQQPGSDVLLSPSVQQVMTTGDDTQREAGWLSQLTPREREVLKLVLDGEDSYQIGERLGISPRTVSTHRSRILQKTNARSFFELIGCLRHLEEMGH